MERSKKKIDNWMKSHNLWTFYWVDFFFSKYIAGKTNGIGDFNTVYFLYKLFIPGNRQMVVCKIDLWIYEEKIYCFIFFWAANFSNTD